MVKIITYETLIFYSDGFIQSETGSHKKSIRVFEDL